MTRTMPIQSQPVGELQDAARSGLAKSANASAGTTMRRRASGWVNTKLKFKLWAQCCRICGRPDDIEVDHVVALSDGGTSDEANLQPLCRVCNVAKRSLKTNEAVGEWIDNNRALFDKRQRARTERAALKLKGEWW